MQFIYINTIPADFNQLFQGRRRTKQKKWFTTQFFAFLCLVNMSLSSEIPYSYLTKQSKSNFRDKVKRIKWQKNEEKKRVHTNTK